MKQTILITGGCRSGKSGHALTLSKQMGALRKVFIATCVAHDDEMRARVQRHQKERSDQWLTLEEPVNVTEAIVNQANSADLIILDCLTLWISNLMMIHTNDDPILKAFKELEDVIIKPPCTIIIVSNEVGAGIVPENALARRFRDLAGWGNQHMAGACQRVIWMVSGIGVTIKAQAPPYAPDCN
ncbi:MAG: bifunctional adenosylcobinamide kinase/adenosylcobinamide-phosphate guanylyltransferase [Desulfobacteraceae bacterium]|nr:bifunctional adenosylcobinamide kinase/adenosylcobinamide-phosphate guanylyltransferase [Desulfobacteraceae bacterium]